MILINVGKDKYMLIKIKTLLAFRPWELKRRGCKGASQADELAFYLDRVTVS